MEWEPLVVRQAVRRFWRLSASMHLTTIGQVGPVRSQSGRLAFFWHAAYPA